MLKCLTAVKRRIQLVASQIRRIFYTKHNVCFSLSGANSLAVLYALQERNKTEFFLNERLTFLHYLFIIHYDHLLINSMYGYTYVLLRSRVQNRRTKWNFPLNFHTMHKLSELYSGIFQTQSSGSVSGLDHFRNFTNLKILNI